MTTDRQVLVGFNVNRKILVCIKEKSFNCKSEFYRPFKCSRTLRKCCANIFCAKLTQKTEIVSTGSQLPEVVSNES